MLPLCRTSPGRFAESARLGTQLDLPHCSASETNSVATSPPLPGPRTPQRPAHEDLLNLYYSKPGVQKFEENARSTWIAVHHSTGWPLTCPHSETTGHFESVLPIVKPACSPFFFVFYLCVKTTSSPMFSRTHPNATQSRASSTWRPVSDQHSRARARTAYQTARPLSTDQKEHFGFGTVGFLCSSRHSVRKPEDNLRNAAFSSTVQYSEAKQPQVFKLPSTARYSMTSYIRSAS
jgi:hypothetical protein